MQWTKKISQAIIVPQLFLINPDIQKNHLFKVNDIGLIKLRNALFLIPALLIRGWKIFIKIVNILNVQIIWYLLQVFNSATDLKHANYHRQQVN